MKKEKKYQIMGQILVAADGWVKARNIEEAKKKWRKFCFSETSGISVFDVEITDIITPHNKYYNKNNVPPDKDFEEAIDKSSITYNYWQ